MQNNADGVVISEPRTPKRKKEVKIPYKSRHGHERTRFAHKNFNANAIGRRKRALERLEEHLKSGIDPKHPFLSEKDITRIKKELETLKSRI